MGQSSDKKSAFGLSGDQIGRLLSIGSGDNLPGVPCQDDPAAQGASPSADSQNPLGTSGPSPQIEGYEIIEKVAEAGQGQVWRALQLSTAREVAIKVPRVGSAASERARLRFEREIELAARLKHPNIARIYDSGVDRGQYYYVMDFIKGVNLDAYVRQNKLTERQILDLVRTICQAVQHAHQNGVIHRDLKPSNVLVADDGNPYVVDFGLAKGLVEHEQDLSVSMDGETVGTPAYMSPEQAAGYTDRLDTRTDIYSLGVILFNLLTGQSPHDLSGSRQQVLRRIADGQVRRPRQVCPSIDKDLEALLLKALDQDPDRRYSSAAGLAEDIRNYLEGAPLVAGPPSRSYRIKKFVRRNRTLVTAILVVGLAIAIGSIVSLTMYVRAEVQTQQSRAVSSLLNETVLRSLDPYREQGGEITPVSVLDAVAAALDGKFLGAPLIEADVRHRLGRTYEANAQYEAAVRHLRWALDIRRRELGEHNPLTLETMARLGWTLHYAGRYHEAEQVLLDLIAEYLRQFGKEDWRTIQTKRKLLWPYMVIDDPQAKQLCQEVLNAARRVLGRTSETATLATLAMGRINTSAGHYDEAERWYREALQLSIQGMGRDHALTRDITGELGDLYLLRGRYPEAERALTEATAHERGIFGERHWFTSQDMWSLVQLYVLWDEPEKARQWRARLGAARSAEASPKTSVLEMA